MSIKDLFMYAGAGTMLLAVGGTVVGMAVQLFARRTALIGARFAPVERDVAGEASREMHKALAQARLASSAPVPGVGKTSVAASASTAGEPALVE